MKALDIRSKRLTLILSPTDLRNGFASLAMMAMNLNINVFKKQDCVVFVSKTRKLCKIIFCDDFGSTLVTRHLHQGRFQQLLQLAQSESRSLSRKQLDDFLNGRGIFDK